MVFAQTLSNKRGNRLVVVESRPWAWSATNDFHAMSLTAYVLDFDDSWSAPRLISQANINPDDWPVESAAGLAKAFLPSEPVKPNSRTGVIRSLVGDQIGMIGIRLGEDDQVQVNGTSGVPLAAWSWGRPSSGDCTLLPTDDPIFGT